MKKILLSAAAVFAALSMNAQEVCVFNEGNALGLDSENGTALTAGTVIGETTSIVATIGADDTYKPQSATFTVNGSEITGGLQGGTNPKDADGGVPATTLIQPASGAFLVFEAKADGYLNVMHKASSNKAYTVFEEGTAISYTFAAIGDASTLLGGVYAFTLPYEVENEQFVVKNSVEWAEQEFLKITNPDAYAANWKEETADDGTTKKTWDPAIKKNGLGVIKFPVYKDCKYIVNANGSKITAAGFVFSTTDNVSISSEGVTIIGEGGTPTIGTWTVAGVSTLCGSNWDPADASNDMKSTDGVNYTLVKEGIVLEKGVNAEFKVVKDHAWDEAYPSENYTFSSEETATFTVTINFNADSKEITTALEKTGEAVIGEKVYSIVGTLTGGWENDVDMELVNGVYSATIQIEEAGTYEYKLRQNHDWAVNWGVDGKQGGDNFKAELPANSSITITFDPETTTINVYVAGGAIVPPVGDGEFCAFNADNVLGLDSENGTALTAGTVIGETESIVATIGADDTYKPQSATFTVNGSEITGGLQGGTNPKDADGGVPATTLIQPASGAFLQFEAKADGYLYVMHKASSNKAYTVFEEGTAISYTFAAIGDASTLLGGVYAFTLPYEVENEQFVVKNSVEWAEQEFLKITNPDAYAANWKEETADDGTIKKTWDPAIKKNGLGVIKFPVYKDCKYIVNANGSKITAIGFYFDTTGDAIITDGEVTILDGNSTAINAAKINKSVQGDGAIYNIAGQKVNASYRGLVIKNGKKFIQK